MSLAKFTFIKSVKVQVRRLCGSMLYQVCEEKVLSESWNF